MTKKLPAIFEHTYNGEKPCLRVMAEDEGKLIDVTISVMRIEGTDLPVKYLMHNGPEPKEFLYLTDSDMWAAYEL